jgi:hypothetical protein
MENKTGVRFLYDELTHIITVKASGSDDLNIYIFLKIRKRTGAAPP